MNPVPILILRVRTVLTLPLTSPKLPPQALVRMAKTITFTVNGQSRTVTTDPERSLLDVLREDLKLTGAKFGCGEGQCRACTVLVDGEPAVSCVTPVRAMEGKII